MRIMIIAFSWQIVHSSVWMSGVNLTESIDNTSTADKYGTSVSVSDDTCIIGAPYFSNNNGMAYIWQRIGGVWTEYQKLTPSL